MKGATDSLARKAETNVEISCCLEFALKTNWKQTANDMSIEQEAKETEDELQKVSRTANVVKHAVRTTKECEYTLNVRQFGTLWHLDQIKRQHYKCTWALANQHDGLKMCCFKIAKEAI